MRLAACLPRASRSTQLGIASSIRCAFSRPAHPLVRTMADTTEHTGAAATAAEVVPAVAGAGEDKKAVREARKKAQEEEKAKKAAEREQKAAEKAKAAAEKPTGAKAGAGGKAEEEMDPSK